MSDDIRQDPLPPSRARSVEDRDDYPDMSYDDEPPYPQTVKTAGVLWIIFGCVVLVNMAVVLLLSFVVAANAQGQAAGLAGGLVCGGVIGGLFGAVFLHVGNQSVRGTAHDTLGNGIGSILFALFYLAAAAAQAVAGMIAQGGVNGLGGAMLFAAGVLALVGRSDYKRWRKAQKERAAREAADRRARRFEN